MSTKQLKLNRESLARLAPSTQIYWFKSHENLGVYVGTNGKRVWRVRLNLKQPNGKTRRKIGTLGLVEHLSIDEAVARKKAAELAALEGIDLTDRKTLAEVDQAPTLSLLLDLYIDAAEIRASTAVRYRKAKAHIDKHLAGKLVMEV